MLLRNDDCLPMRFAGRAFLFRGRREPHHRGRDVLRAGRVVAAGAGSGEGVRAYGVYLQEAGLGDGAAGCRLSIDVSWLDAIGADSGVACTSGSLAFA